jgi:hypothetical protein
MLLGVLSLIMSMRFCHDLGSKSQLVILNGFMKEKSNISLTVLLTDGGVAKNRLIRSVFVPQFGL